jgi:hypothetical protein
MTFTAVDTELQARGCAPGRPRRRGRIDGPALDAQIAQASVCEACGHAGLNFTSYVDGTQQSAAAVARCPQCDAAFDF